MSPKHADTQDRLASLESLTIFNEYKHQARLTPNPIPSTRQGLYDFIELPKDWKPSSEYFRQDPKIEKVVLRGPIDDPIEYEDPKFKLPATISHADPHDCNDSTLSATLKRRSAERVTPLLFEKGTNRPMVRYNGVDLSRAANLLFNSQ